MTRMLTVSALPALSLCTIAVMLSGGLTSTAHSASPASSAPTVHDARALLEDVAATYREAAALSDTLEMTFDYETVQMDFRFDDRGNTQIRMPGGVITVLDGQMYIEDDLQPKKYLAVPLEDDDIEATLKSIYGPETLLPYHFVMRAGRGVDASIESFTFGFFDQPQLDGVREIQTNEGERRHEIRIVNNDSEALVHIHPQTRLVTGLAMDLPSPVFPDGDEKIVVTVNADPQIADALEPPIAFEPGDREQVTDPQELTPEPRRMVRNGEPAPSFTVETLDGDEVSLDDMSGHVVVLDFWATWCIPCIRALPKLDSFAQWVQDEELPIKVYAVNVWEHQAPTREQREEMVSKFWNDQEYALLTTLMDYEDSMMLEFGYDSLPTTVIIDPDGNVFRTHVGYSQGMEQMLRDDALAALEN